MELDRENKTKTYFVVTMFLVIILLSAYVVVDKIIKRNEHDIKLDNFNKTTNSILDKSTLVTELSLDNKFIKEIYDYIDYKDAEYLLYLDGNKKINWNIKSLIVSKNINKSSKNLEILYIDREEFEKIYSNIFGDDINKLSVEERTASICGAASYDFENDMYVVNLNCTLNNNMKTFYKNITFKDDEILINKYYVFVDKYEDEEIEEYNLYLSDKFNEDNLLVENIKAEDINDYISDMNVITFKYSKSKDGNYYFDGIE